MSRILVLCMIYYIVYIISNPLYQTSSSLHLIQKDASRGTLTFKTGLHRAATLVSVKMES